MKLKRIVLLITLLLIFPLNAHADCESEKEYFKTIEDKFKVYYEVNHDTKSIDLIIENPDSNRFTSSIYILDYEYDYNYEKECKNDSKNKLRCTNFPKGNCKIGIEHIKDNNCKVSTKEIDIPVYNKYQNDKLCEGLDNFYLCQETVDEDIDYDTFISRINTYINKKQKQEDIPKEEQTDVIEYINNNKTTIIVYTVFTILVIITIILTIKSQKDKRVLK